jgi:plasmid stabilization system protein ParE
MERYILAPEALQDLQDIWDFIAVDNPEAASALQEEFFQTFTDLAIMPGKGHKREDLTDRPVLFFRVRSYLIVYSAGSDPLQIVAVLHAARDIPTVLRR